VGRFEWVEVRSVQRNEASEIRALRLRAMADAPFAFSSSLAREVGRPPEFWDELARKSEESTSWATFVAVEDDVWVGMAGVFIAPDDPECGQVWGTWVDPGVRRGGIGRQLMAAIRAWATTHGLERLQLSVSTSDRSGPARDLYETLGFRRTGDQEPMESDPALRADVMALALP
jgi:GNAT superfamily N-acetyltransferase